jgi:tetratricopeptide (TPR) repeat protein
MTSPKVTRDPRFLAGRKLVQDGLIDDPSVIQIFAVLCEESRTKYGDAHIETAPAYYEYGNVLLRTYLRSQDGEEEEGDVNEDEESSSKRPAAVIGNENSKPDHDNNRQEVAETTDGGNDLELALEMMENAYSILANYCDSYSASSNDESQKYEYKEWVEEQLPRVLLGIGDALGPLQRHADAAEVYSQALEKRQARLDGLTTAATGKDELSVDILKAHRHVVEATVLVAESLLACDPNQDVVTTETKALIVKKDERVDFVQGYYDKARDTLQETVYYMGKVVARGIDVEQEKENVCFAATLVMGVGEMLAEAQEQEPPAKKLKVSK